MNAGSKGQTAYWRLGMKQNRINNENANWSNQHKFYLLESAVNAYSTHTLATDQEWSQTISVHTRTVQMKSCTHHHQHHHRLQHVNCAVNVKRSLNMLVSLNIQIERVYPFRNFQTQIEIRAEITNCVHANYMVVLCPFRASSEDGLPNFDLFEIDFVFSQPFQMDAEIPTRWTVCIYVSLLWFIAWLFTYYVHSLRIRLPLTRFCVCTVCLPLQTSVSATQLYTFFLCAVTNLPTATACNT